MEIPTFYLTLIGNWHELWKQEKCSSSAPPMGMFYKPRGAWQGVKLTRLMSIFTSKKVWKFLIKIQLTKSNPKRTRGWKVPSLMPIRVNWPSSSGWVELIDWFVGKGDFVITFMVFIFAKGYFSLLCKCLFDFTPILWTKKMAFNLLYSRR